MRRLNAKNLVLKKRGLTVVECLFAMVIMLVGLIGIAAMVPFAARQAADSYQIVHALSTGENALAVSNSNAVVTPTLNAPWQLLDDVYALNPSSTTGLPSLPYVAVGLVADTLANPPATFVSGSLYCS